MNQILVTQKLYITPELRRKQAFYKFCFFLSIFTIGVLFSVYVYGLYDQNMNENISKELLSSVALDTSLQAANTPNEETILVRSLDDISEDEIIQVDIDIKKPENNTPLQSTYTASNGKDYDIVGIINIPSLEINYPILSNTNDDLLKVSVCKFEGPEPNNVGNLCIAGHNFTNTRAFSKLVDINIDDIIEITDLSGKTLKYKVIETYIVAPTDLSCTSQRTNGKKEVTLITCTNGNRQRRIVKAIEIPQIQQIVSDDSNQNVIKIR